jgi:hypothetical protein
MATLQRQQTAAQFKRVFWMNFSGADQQHVATDLQGGSANIIDDDEVLPGEAAITRFKRVRIIGLRNADSVTANGNVAFYHLDLNASGFLTVGSGPLFVQAVVIPVATTHYFLWNEPHGGTFITGKGTLGAARSFGFCVLKQTFTESIDVLFTVD